MLSKPLTRILSVVLILATLVSYFPTAYAADTELVEDVLVEQVVETTEVPATEAATEPAAEPETEPATEPAAEPETEPEAEPAAEPETEAATEPAAEPETEPATEAATEPAAEPETEPATEPAVEETEPATEPEETEPEEIELPYGFNGMPEGYELNEEELAAKAEITADGTVERIAGLTAGVDYVDGELIFACEDEAYAAMVAYAYDALLTDCSYGVASIQLQNATVLEAVTAAADMEIPLPAVQPNYIGKITPIEGDGVLEGFTDTLGLPERQSWETWVFENLADPDPFISDPQGDWFQWHHDTINTYEAWGVTTGKSTIKVAVIDSGVTSHTDIANLSYKDIGYGTTDDVGHGTHVAGIIASSLDNGKGGAGVAPNVSILSIKAGNDGGFSDAALAQAINAAVSSGAHIINMSLGGPFPNSTLRYAINNAIKNNVTIVAAMGNDGSNAINYPAAYDGVIGVVATDSAGKRSFYSNYGSWADVCAPGSDILSTYPGNDYVYMDGTSMACPVVAGVCALYMSAVGRVSPSTMESVLEKSCNKVSGSGMGAGIVDAAKMFDKTPNIPELIIRNNTQTSYYYPASGSEVTCDNYIDFFSNVSDNNDTLIYTINGKTPSVKNGKVVNGILYGGPISLEQYVGTTITVKAAAVTGMGKISKVMTMKLKVVKSNKVESINIVAPDKLGAGKSVKLSAVVKPADTADQSVTWSIISRTGDTSAVTISANGTLTTYADRFGTVTVKAVSAVNSSISDTHTITINNTNPVATIKLEKSKTSVMAGSSVQLFVASLMDKNQNPIAGVDCGLQWTSSNKKVATVNEYGYVTGIAKGKVTITCKALDGSGKSAKCTVTVKQPAEHITVTGNDTVVSGSSITMKATVTPSNTDNKSVKWELVQAPFGATVSSKGVVKVPAGVATGTVIKVRATSVDTDYVYGQKTIYVSPKTTAVNVDYAGPSAGSDRITWNSKGYVSAIKLTNTDLYADATYSRKEAQLVAYTSGNGYTDVKWSSSNNKVATVSEDGLVTGVGKGTATITCKALDGSGKKATIKVTVNVPVSQITIKTNAPQMTAGYPCVAFGKSVKNSVVFGTTYGKPSNTKVSWSYRVFGADANGNLKAEYTTFCKNNSLVSLKNGTLKVSSKMKTKLWYQMPAAYDIVIQVTATAKDGSGVSGSQYFYAIPGATKLKCVDAKNLKGRVNHDGYYVMEIYSDQMFAFSEDYTRFFTATSSNPKVVSVYDVAPVFYSNGARKDGYYYVYIAALSAGKAKITIKTADGTNLKCSFNVTITN